MSLDGPEDDIEYYVKYLSKKWDIERVPNENEVERINNTTMKRPNIIFLASVQIAASYSSE